MDLGKYVIVTTEEGFEYNVRVEAAILMETIKDVIEDTGIEAPIPLPAIPGNIFSKLIIFCVHQIDVTKSAVEIENWNNNFIKIQTKTDLYELALASNWVNLKKLLRLITDKIASLVKGKSTENMRKILNVKNDWNEGEEDEIRNEHSWHKVVI